MTLKGIKSFRKRIEKDWGKKCSEFNISCCVCQVHLAMDILVERYDYVIASKVKK